MEKRPGRGLSLVIVVLLAWGCTSKPPTQGMGDGAVTGGVVVAGGSLATGGVVTTTGGMVEKGGAIATGGVRGTGGVQGTGGLVATGGVAVSDGSVRDASAGCGKAGAPTGVLTAQTIAVGGRNRTYVLSVPKSYTSGSAWPLVFAWHGLGGSGNLARQYFGVESSSSAGAIFAYPDGLPVSDGGSAGWDLANTGIDMAFFDALLAFLGDSYCVDRNRIFATGHSYGGMMTNALGCYRGDVLRAIAPVAGMPPNAYGGRAVACVGNVGALVIHGQNDPTVDFTRGGIGARDFWIARNTCQTATQPGLVPECLANIGCQADLPVQFCVHNQAHAFPNGRCDGATCLVGGATVWNFFKSFL